MWLIHVIYKLATLVQGAEVPSSLDSQGIVLPGRAFPVGVAMNYTRSRLSPTGKELPVLGGGTQGTALLPVRVMHCRGCVEKLRI